MKRKREFSRGTLILSAVLPSILYINTSVREDAPSIYIRLSVGLYRNETFLGGSECMCVCMLFDVRFSCFDFILG